MAFALELDTTEWEQLADSLDQLGVEVEREVRKAVRQAVAVMETNIVGLTPVGVTANLSQSWSTEVRAVNQHVLSRGIVASSMNYSSAVEKGRRPGRMPPIEPIRLWVVRKGIAPPSEADSAAFLIARAIGRRGTKGQRMVKRGVKQSEAQLQRIFDRVPERLIRRLAR